MMAPAAEAAIAVAASVIALAPLGAALAASLAKRFALAWTLMLIALAAAAGLALAAALRAPLDPAAAPNPDALGLSLHAAALIAAPTLATCAALAAAACGAWLGPRREAHPAAMTLFGVSAFGWIGAALAHDLLHAALFIQAGWFAAAGLTALRGGQDRAALAAGLRMTLAGAFGAALLTIGIALLARATGGAGIEQVGTAPLGRVGVGGLALTVLALCAYAGLAPVQTWAPAAFGRGEPLIGFLLGAVAPVACLSLVIRLAAAAMRDPGAAFAAQAFIGGLGAAAILYASVQAIGARDLRRMAGYALAAQGGCLLVGASIGGPVAVAAALLQAVNIAIVSMALFAGAALLAGDARLEAIEGLGRRAPLSGAAIAIGSLSLIGAPLTFGFLVRWRLIEAALQAAEWWAAAAQVAASLAAVVYAGRVLERLYLRPGRMDLIPRSAWRVALSPALAAPIAAAVGFGLNASLLWRAALHAGQVLTGAGA
ncbi:MAG: proton-conducting transporter membrane subunit [Hyphomonadaceae bacterium]|nr:proton-conducting transporter membrane subunit [Hyphomonadaceae bacterium]